MVVRSANVIRAKVEALLAQYGVTKAPIDVIGLAEKLGSEVKFSPFEDHKQLSGMIFRDDERVIIGVNSLHPKTRQRFTVAHEIGHLLLHRGDKLFVDEEFR